ncbi:MAG: hypothetical protein ACO3ND_05640 [Opitutales bacterium]
MGLYIGLRLLPDTQCTLLHAAHDPLVVDGMEFCGVNEQANYYSPSAMKFPVTARLELSAESGTLTLLTDGVRPLLPHEVAVSHTRRVHLHLRQEGGVRAYVHVHPEPTDDGGWKFAVPPDFAAAAAGSKVRAFVDFVSARTRRAMLAECIAELPGVPGMPPAVQGLRVTLERDRFTAGAADTLRIKVSGRDPVNLRPVMGALGHAVVFGDQQVNPGYAHMHPTWEGRDREPEPLLAFRLRMPGPGRYDLWLHLDDGEERYLRASFDVIP